MKRCAKYIPSVLLLILLMVLAGLYSMWLGIDVNFDLLNYHLYNPYAFLEGKTGQDLFAAGVHSALNPLLDIYFYKVFFTFFNAPKWIAFFMGLPYGVLVWLVYYFAKYLYFLAAHIGLQRGGDCLADWYDYQRNPLGYIKYCGFLAATPRYTHPKTLPVGVCGGGCRGGGGGA